MTTPEPLLLLTDDDLLAQRWQDLAPSPLRARGIDGLDAWRAAGHRLVLVDLGCARGGTAPVWTRPAWQRNASGLAILAASSNPDDDEGLAVLNAGASGYCHSHAPADTLRQALPVIASGELWVGRALLSRLLRLVDTRLPVLLNFAANAVKFTEHGEIALSARPVSEIDGEVVVRFEVRDTGCGFDPLKAASLFHSFVQADASVTRQHGGTGLGLAICQQIVELMRGNIGAESTPGKGSCFWFEIPLERGSSTELPSPEASRQLRGKRAILLIVAEPQVARLSERLKALGIAVQRANSAGDLALRMETAARIGRAYDFVFCTGEPPGCVEFCQRDIQTRILNPSHGIPPKRVLCLDPSSQPVPDIPDADCFDARIQLDCDTDTFERCLAGLPPGASTLSKPARAAIRRIERLDALNDRGYVSGSESLSHGA